MSKRYDWSRFRRLIDDAAPDRVIEPEEEPTVRVPRESCAETMRRPATRSAAELDAELLQHSGEAGR